MRFLKIILGGRARAPGRRRALLRREPRRRRRRRRRDKDLSAGARARDRGPGRALSAVRRRRGHTHRSVPRDDATKPARVI